MSVHPAFIADEKLLKECTVSFGRSSGPGGSNRNKVETAVRLEHRPTGVLASAVERRSQAENRRMALWRLRIKLAMEVRRPVDPKRYDPTPLWRLRRQGEKLSVNPQHHDYPALLAEALDVVCAADFDVGASAGVLGITMSQLVRLFRHERHALAMVNDGRVAAGLPALR